MKNQLVTLLIATLCATSGFAQDGIVKTSYSKDSIITFRVFDTKTKKIEDSKSKETIKELIQAGNNDDLVLQQSRTDELGYTHYFYQQTYKGIKVENGMYVAHAKNGLVESVNGDFFKTGTVEVNAKLSESEALTKALEAIGAQKYKWQIKGEETFIRQLKNDSNATYYPKGEKVIIYSSVTKTFRLAYKFNIYAQYPLSRNNVFIDAITGEVLGKQNLIFDTNATGSADTRYSGTQNITADYSSSYRLRELTNSVRIETYNMRNQDTCYSTAPDFSDNDNNWTAAEYNNANYDNAALDAHWGAEKVYAYWNTVRMVNSWNGSGAPLLNYVHTNLTAFGYTDNDNAFWDGEKMTYADGQTAFNPVVSLDVIAHEIGHGFCSGVRIIRNYSYDILSSELVPESKALNEGMSDIWAACVENWAAPTKQCWQVGEEIMKNGFSCLRSLRSPKTEGYRKGYSTEGNYPDTYGYTPWYNGTDASTFSHTNATVLSHWFYLLSAGGTGTNDLGNSYSVSSIGITNAASIAWRAELYKFTASTDFSSARDLLIQAATELYTANSCEVKAVTDAWYAVGIGSPFQYTNVNISGPTLICSSGSFTVNVPSGCTVYWDKSSNLTLPTDRTTNPIVATANGNGSGWVQASINSTTCGSVTLPQYTVWVGNPIPANIQGPSQLPVGCIVNYSISAQGSPTSYQWSMAGRIICPPNQQWSYLYGDLTSTATLFAGCQSRYIGVTVGNQCGTAYVGKYVEIGNYNCNGGMKMLTDTTIKEPGIDTKGDLVIYPNPASDNVQVSVIQPAVSTQNSVLSTATSDQSVSITYSVKVFNIYGTLVYTLNKTSSPFTIPLSSLNNGNYIIVVYDNNNNIYQNQLIVKH